MSMPTPKTVDPEQVGMSSKMLANIEPLVQGHMREKAYKGIVVLVARHGKICYFQSFGDADEGKPMPTDAVFRLASMSKPIAAVAVLQLFDQGKIALSDPISKFIPEFKDPKVAEVRDWGVVNLVTAKREILIHDLLSMTAGLTNTWWYGLFTPTAYQVVPKMYADAGIFDDFSERDITLEENIKNLAKMPLIGNPGEVFDYSNNSVDTLCRMVEVVSGKRFDEYVSDNIWKPLGMTETWFYPPEKEFSRIPAIYWAGKDEKQTEESPLGAGMMGPNYTYGKYKSYFSGAAGMHGTTYNYYRFAQMLLNRGTLDGVRVLSRQAVELMTSNQIGALTNWQLTQNKWGYMVDIQEGVSAPPTSFHYLGGKGAYSWQGFWSTKFCNNPATDTVILSMTTPGFDGALPHNCRVIAAASAAIED